MFFLANEIPAEFENLSKQLVVLARDLRWTWSHSGDAFWKYVDAEVWSITRNPYAVLQKLSVARLRELAGDHDFIKQLADLSASRDAYLQHGCWADQIFFRTDKALIAYFSMEFGLGDALRLYAGGLGVLAGDHLKACSDLGVPLVGIGLLFDQGYFRQMLDANGAQRELYAYNDSRNLPLQPTMAGGRWLTVEVKFPGRKVYFQVWQAQVGRVTLYLLDSNDPLNHPADQGITGSLYNGSLELRLEQEIALGVGGWRVIEALKLPVGICHLNEGHAALAALERTRCFKEKNGVDFWQALWATRAGNIFTTHTPIAAAFDTFPQTLLERYGADYANDLGIDANDLLALGRVDKTNRDEPFNMAYMAARTCARVNGVSQLHGETSRHLFQSLYPGWPVDEVPITHITNGVHVPTWDSPYADKVWTDACGKSRWMNTLEPLAKAIMNLSDEDIWNFCSWERADLVRYARSRLARQFAQRGADTRVIHQAQTVLDPNTLTLGFARRFTEYKRPNLLLQNPERLARLLTNSERPVQLLIAGKAHPKDGPGKRFIQEWVRFLERSDVRAHAVFLEDYDMALALELVQGVDVWINTPRRPWEACGTSGMKVLANGGINLSTLDGWWSEAFTPDVGWALGDGKTHREPNWDNITAEQLYALLEQEVVPTFYQRDGAGIPRRWVEMVRTSMARLAPKFSSNRMVREYSEKVYLPALEDFNRRSESGAEVAKVLSRWHANLTLFWSNIQWGNFYIYQRHDTTRFEVQVYHPDISPDDIRVQLYSESNVREAHSRLINMERAGPIQGSTNAYVYAACLPTQQEPDKLTPRIVAFHSEAHIPAETDMISWWSGERQLITDNETTTLIG